MSEIASGPVHDRLSVWSDEFIHFDGIPLYIRKTTGPNYEKALLCFDDGDADMRDLASMSLENAAVLAAVINHFLAHQKQDGTQHE